MKNTCDAGHTTQHQVKVLPVVNGNSILCHFHFDKEIKYRAVRNQELDESSKFDIPKWTDLKVYNPE